MSIAFHIPSPMHRRLRAAGPLALLAFLAGLPAGEPAAAPAATPSWAELPHWPIALPPADEPGANAKEKPKAKVLAWLPDGVRQPRALLMVLNNSDSKDAVQHSAIRAVAAKHAMGIVYIRKYPGYEIGAPKPDQPKDLRQAVLDELADSTGIAEFRHAPWIAFGKSSCGPFAHHAAWLWPQRTIAQVIYHGAVPDWPPPASAKLDGETILHLNLNGEVEWGGTWYRHVRPSLLNYRSAKGWLPHQALARGVGHGDYVDAAGSEGWGKPVPAGKLSCRQVWDYLALFMDKALALRLPAEGLPSAGPLALRAVDGAATGLYADPFAIEAICRVPRYPLVERDGLFLVGDGADPAVNGYARIAPRSEPIPEGVPVVPLTLGRSPTRWLIAGGQPFTMVRDPMSDLGGLEGLHPKPGDAIDFEGKPTAFAVMDAKHVGVTKERGESGISLKNGLRPVPPWKDPTAMALVAYTVIEIPTAGAYRVRAPFSAGGRLQAVLNGRPVDHLQVVELDAGRYPLLAVLRLTPNWGTVEPWLEAVSAEEVALAKTMTGERERRLAELAVIRGKPKPGFDDLFVPAAKLGPEQRAKMMWFPDRELAEAWMALMTIGDAP